MENNRQEGAAHAQRWYEVTDYMVGPLSSQLLNTVIVNADVWNGLPPDIQQIMLEEGAGLSHLESRPSVIPAKAGIHVPRQLISDKKPVSAPLWIPVFAGITGWKQGNHGATTG